MSHKKYGKEIVKDSFFHEWHAGNVFISSRVTNITRLSKFLRQKKRKKEKRHEFSLTGWSHAVARAVTHAIAHAHPHTRLLIQMHTRWQLRYMNNLERCHEEMFRFFRSFGIFFFFIPNTVKSLNNTQQRKTHLLKCEI